MHSKPFRGLDFEPKTNYSKSSLGWHVQDVVTPELCRHELDMQNIWMHDREGLDSLKKVEDELEESDEEVKEKHLEFNDELEENLDLQSIGGARVSKFLLELKWWIDHEAPLVV